MSTHALRELWTIGHWTCPMPVFLEPLHAQDIALLVDVRAQPGSRRNPQFGQDAMGSWLPEEGVDYLHLPEPCAGPGTRVESASVTRPERARARVAPRAPTRVPQPEEVP